jgi:hypothetical protein
MADEHNVVQPYTLLQAITYPKTSALCTDYSLGLLLILNEMQLGLDARFLNIAFNPINSYDAHTLVEMYNPDLGRWMLLDPTFDLSPKRSADGSWATAEDMSSAARSMSWNDISYELLGTRQAAYASAYYLDYPLLYLNVRFDSGTFDPAHAPSLLPYLTEQTFPQAANGFYLVRSTSTQPVTISNSGGAFSTSTNGVDNLSAIFFAYSVDVLDSPSDLQLFTPNRYVFQ